MLTTIYLITFQISVGYLNQWFIGQLIMWFKGPINSHFYILDLQAQTLTIFQLFNFWPYTTMDVLFRQTEHISLTFTFFDQILYPNISKLHS